MRDRDRPVDDPKVTDGFDSAPEDTHTHAEVLEDVVAAALEEVARTSEAVGASLAVDDRDAGIACLRLTGILKAIRFENDILSLTPNEGFTPDVWI